MSIRTLIEVKTPAAVLDALGGTSFAAKRYRLSPQAISNWKSRGIPSRYEIRTDIEKQLEAKGMKAAPAVWAKYARAAAAPRRKRKRAA